MSARGAEKGVYNSRDVLDGFKWSISWLRLWDE